MVPIHPSPSHQAFTLRRPWIPCPGMKDQGSLDQGWKDSAVSGSPYLSLFSKPIPDHLPTSHLSATWPPCVRKEHSTSSPRGSPCRTQAAPQQCLLKTSPPSSGLYSEAPLRLPSLSLSSSQTESPIPNRLLRDLHRPSTS